MPTGCEIQTSKPIRGMKACAETMQRMEKKIEAMVDEKLNKILNEALLRGAEIHRKSYLCRSCGEHRSHPRLSFWVLRGAEELSGLFLSLCLGQGSPSRLIRAG